MKITKKILLSSFITSMLSFTSIYAAWVDHFEVKLNPENSNVWDALDLSIEAVDKNNSVVTDYQGSILIFSESDPEAELPTALSDNIYDFVWADQWKVTFENSIKFNNEWVQNIHIYDFDDDTVYWIAEATISKSVTDVNIDIDIITPENGLTIWENKIKISGSSKKNHQIKITVNWETEIMTTTSEEWIFEKEIQDLKDWENTFLAEVLDWDLNIVWTSNEVKIKVETSSISIKNLKTIPEEIFTESAYEIELIASEWLYEVSAIINEVIIKLKEEESGVYKVKTYAPKKANTYAIDLILKDSLGHEKKELWAWSIEVKEVVLEAPKEEVEVIEEALDSPSEKSDLKITGLKLVELKSRSILTWDKVKEAKSYNVYKKFKDWKLELIENVSEPKFEVAIIWDDLKYEYFAVKALAETEDWEIYEWNLSDATKIKTGPEILILMLLALIIWFWVFTFQRKHS